ncbi:MAG: hypothetical protein U0995_05455 [Erythrobacter sp.]|nr:hypothetical protein [Erythrobacter sp.]
MERIGALTRRKVGLKADDPRPLVIVDEHQHATKIIIAYRKGEENGHDAVIALPHIGKRIFHPRGLYLAANGAKRHALFINGHARFFCAVTARGVASKNMVDALIFETRQRERLNTCGGKCAHCTNAKSRADPTNRGWYERMPIHANSPRNKRFHEPADSETTPLR